MPYGNQERRNLTYTYQLPHGPATCRPMVFICQNSFKFITLWVGYTSEYSYQAQGRNLHQNSLLVFIRWILIQTVLFWGTSTSINCIWKTSILTFQSDFKFDFTLSKRSFHPIPTQWKLWVISCCSIISAPFREKVDSVYWLIWAGYTLKQTDILF